MTHVNFGGKTFSTLNSAQKCIRTLFSTAYDGENSFALYSYNTHDGFQVPSTFLKATADNELADTGDPLYILTQNNRHFGLI